MENSLKLQHNQNPSPRSYTTNSSTSSSNSATTNGLHHHHQPPPPSPTPPPQSPIPVTRSDPNNLNPTTFVQADTSSFKQVVQMLTGSSETAKVAAAPPKPEPPRNPNPPVRAVPKIQKSNSKLYERRNSFRNFKICPLGPGLIHSKPGHTTGLSPRPGTPEILSPSMLDFPVLSLSPVTPLIPDPFNRTGQFLNSKNNLKSNLNDLEAEEKAIAEKGFFLHPSPASTPTDSKPRLLPLFPETSPRVAGSSNSAA